MPIAVNSGSSSFAAPCGLRPRVSHRTWLSGRQRPPPGPCDPRRDAHRRSAHGAPAELLRLGVKKLPGGGGWQIGREQTGRLMRAAAQPNAASRCSPPSPTRPRRRPRIWWIAALPIRLWVMDFAVVRTRAGCVYTAFVTSPKRPTKRSLVGQDTMRTGDLPFRRSIMRCGKRIQICPSLRIILAAVHAPLRTTLWRYHFQATLGALARATGGQPGG